VVRRAWADRIEALERHVQYINKAFEDEFKKLDVRIRALDCVDEVNLQELRADLRELRRTLDALLMDRNEAPSGLKTLLDAEVEEEQDALDAEEQDALEKDWKQFQKAYGQIFGDEVIRDAD